MGEPSRGRQGTGELHDDPISPEAHAMMLWLFLILLLPLQAQAAAYYMSPSGSDANNGTSSGSPWLTFTKAFSVAVCGDRIILLNGVYGDGTSTGRPVVSGRTCTASTRLTIMALNSRQARIHGNGTVISVQLINSAYITLDGLAISGTSNSGVSGAGTSCSSG